MNIADYIAKHPMQCIKRLCFPHICGREPRFNGVDGFTADATLMSKSLAVGPLRPTCTTNRDAG
jgi:hypothetical protein